MMNRKNVSWNLASAAVSVACAMASVPLTGHAEEATSEGSVGWISTGWSTYDFFSADNWDQGLITGEFGSGLGTEKFTQTITFGQDWSGNLSFSHSNEATLTLCGDGSRDATWFVPGDVAFAANTSKGRVTFGSQKEGSKFYIDLGGKSPTFTMKGTGGYYFNNAISNGAFRIGGESTSVVSFYNDDATVDGDIYLHGTSKLQFDSSAKDSSGTVRAKNVYHGGNELELKGGSSATEDTIDGMFRILDDSAGMRTVSIYAPSTNTILRAKKLEIAPGAFVCFRGTSLGLGVPEVTGANLFFEETPTLVDGLIPQAVALTTMDGGTSSNLSFAGYDAAKGVRVLDLETEFVTDVASLASGTENLLVPHGTTTTITGETTVNAVLMKGGEEKSPAALGKGDDTAKLRVTSGQFVIAYSRNAKPYVNVPVDFGAARGCISHSADKWTEWNSTISGSGGIVFATYVASLAGAGLSLNSDCDYSGNAYVNSSLYIAADKKVFPYGSRQGDLYVWGNLAFKANSSGYVTYQTVNGLYGDGTIREETGKRKLDFSFGDNDADGDFTGTLSVLQNVTKIGAGRQRLGGTVACKGVLSVSSGTVILDGTVVSNETTAATVSVAADAAIGGAGAIETSLAFAANAKLRVEVADGKAKGPLTVAAISAAGEVTVEVDSAEWKGSYSVLKVTEGTLEGITFKKGANIGSLALSADKTELIATKSSGFRLIIR